MRGRLWVGTSGFAYKSWKPEFYPAELKDREMLRYYAERLPSVEINNTFYRSPTAALLEGWSAQVPESFRFTLKAPQRITHIARLKDVDEPLGRFLDTARILGSRLGAILFQCPPTLRFDGVRLDSFLAALPREGFRLALEFRHESWNDDVVSRALAAAGVARAVVDDEARTGDPEAIDATPGFVYARLRRGTYEEAALEAWAKGIARALDSGADAYVYLKHEDDPSGVRFALRLCELAG